MIKIGDTTINPLFVVSAEVDHTHYANGTATHLVVHLADGRRIRREHGWGFDAYATKKHIDEALGVNRAVKDLDLRGMIDDVCGEWNVDTPIGFATDLQTRIRAALGA